MIRLTWLVVVLCAVTPALSAASFSDQFIGLSTDVTMSTTVFEEPAASVLRIGQHFTYGSASLDPLRIRGGIGWYKNRPFAVTAGIELPLIEHLSSRKSRAFGMYLLGDIGVIVQADVGMEVQGWLFGSFPVSPIGALAAGVGIDSINGLVLAIGYWAGVRPLENKT